MVAAVTCTLETVLKPSSMAVEGVRERGGKERTRRGDEGKMEGKMEGRGERKEKKKTGGGMWREGKGGQEGG